MESNIINNFCYGLSYWVYNFGMNLSLRLNSVYDLLTPEKFKNSIYKVEVVNIEYQYVKTVYKRPFYDVILAFIGTIIKTMFNIDFSNNYCIHHIPPHILTKYQDDNVHFNIVTWDNDNKLVRDVKDMFKNREYNYIFVMIQCPIKLDITFFVNNHLNVFRCEEKMKFSNMFVLMHLLEYIDQKTLVYLLSNAQEIVISAMDKDLNEKIIKSQLYVEM